MTRLRILHNLRTAVLLLAVVGVVGGIGILVWANQTGLPDQWRRGIEQEIAKHANGTRVKIGGLSYLPMRGIVASDVELFDTKDPDTRTAYLQRVVLDLDLSKLLHGEVRLLRLELSDAMISLPTNPGAPELVIEHANGRVLMNAGRTIEVRDASGRIGGIRIDFGARLLGHGPGIGNEEDQRARIAARRLLIARIAEELQHWSFNPDDPPLIKVFVEGELDLPEAMRVDLSVRARDLEKGGYSLHKLDFAGELVVGVLSLDHLRAEDDFGKLDARLDYDLAQRSGKFSGTSDLDLLKLLRGYFDLTAPPDFSFSSPPSLEATGSFNLHPDTTPDWTVVGTASSGPFMFRGSAFDGLSTRFSTTPGAVYLREAEIRHTHGTARGKLLVRDRRLRVQLGTDIPLLHWRPFFADSPLTRTLDLIKEKPGSSLSINLEGGLDLDNPRNWSCGGSFQVDEIAYRDVAFHHLESQFSLNILELEFENVKAVLNDSAYPLRRQPSSRPSAKLERLVIDLDKWHAIVEGLEARCWPGQVTRMFSTSLATRFEEYRFHSPPRTRSHGVIDFSDPHGGDATDFHCSVRTTGISDYRFLDHTIPLTDARAEVHVRKGRTDVDGLEFETFGGKLAGNLTFSGSGSRATTRSEFQWTRLLLPEIARIYQFEMKGGGMLTGRAEFSGTSGTIGDLNGHGSIALEDGEMFAVPIFGPLSPLISGVLGNKNAGFETARDAFCTYTIENGTLFTNDFHTQTTSIDFTGEGRVELVDKTIDMTMRLDARGLLGVITLPLRPFYGLFQFRGTGKLNKPDWRSVLFTAPAGKIEPESPPKAYPVGEPPRARVVAPPGRTPSPSRRLGRPGRGTP